MSCTGHLNHISELHFDTLCSISADCSEQILKQAMQLCQPYNALLSRTEVGSDVWNLNHAGGRAIAISEHTEKILRLSQQLTRDSAGAFHIAVGAAGRFWRAAGAARKLPDHDVLSAEVERMLRSEIVIMPGVAQLTTGTEIDLGGIAKGYIAERIADYLRANTVQSALINLGGDIVTVGSKPDGTPWKLGIQSPDGVWGQDYWAVISCQDEALVTSGVYERGFMLNSTRYHHILDPRTGWPVQNGLSSVSVLSKDAMLADGLSTAIFVLGPEEGMALAQKYNVGAVLLNEAGQVLYSPNVNLTLVDQT